MPAHTTWRGRARSTRSRARFSSKPTCVVLLEPGSGEGIYSSLGLADSRELRNGESIHPISCVSVSRGAGYAPTHATATLETRRRDSARRPHVGRRLGFGPAPVHPAFAGS